MVWWRSGYKDVRLATERSQVRVPVAPLHITTMGKLFTHSVPLFTKQYKLVPAIGWEGNRRSGVALAMLHRLTDLVVYPPTGSMDWEWEMSTSPKLLSKYYDIFYYNCA